MVQSEPAQSWRTCPTTDESRHVAELRQLNEQKDRFIVVLAHELRGPLAPIASAVEVLAASGGDSPVVRRACDIMSRQIGVLHRLVDDLLDLGLIAHGTVTLRRLPIDVGTVIDAAIEAVRPLMEQRAQIFTRESPSEPLMMSADAARLTQVFTNLLHNSAKYTSVGGRIALDVQRRESCVQVRVRDSGIGIAPESLSNIFGLFVRAVPASYEASGLGVGLALVRQLVELHGGQVRAHSDGIGRGSEFVTRLPLLECSAKSEVA
jgi:signal transduction histidine kinase